MIYVCSDIHGRWEKYEAMLKLINLQPEDTLYILGDVIDRGKDGIKILIDIMQRENVNFLPGNHEYMMYNALTSFIMENKQYKFLYEAHPDIRLWFNNSGKSTLMDFSKQSKEIQEYIMKFIEDSYVAIPNLKVGDKQYYLVHACPSVQYNDEPVRFKDLLQANGVLDLLLWERIFDIELDDKIAVIGHTITTFFSYANKDEMGKCKIHHGKGLIAMDCGCSRTDSSACLGCLRLDDMKEFYV